MNLETARLEVADYIATAALSHTEDTKEAQRAFTEKRKPVFKGE